MCNDSSLSQAESRILDLERTLDIRENALRELLESVEAVEAENASLRQECSGLDAVNRNCNREIERLRKERDMLQVGYKAAESSRRLAIVELNVMRAVVEKADTLVKTLEDESLSQFALEDVHAYQEARHAG